MTRESTCKALITMFGQVHKKCDHVHCYLTRLVKLGGSLQQRLMIYLNAVCLVGSAGQLFCSVDYDWGHSSGCLQLCKFPCFLNEPPANLEWSASFFPLS